MIILGINAYHGDASAALVVDGQLVAAVEEERFNRVKHWAGLPIQAIRYCLEEAGLQAAQVDHIAISRNPRAHLAGKIAFALSHRPSWKLVRNRLSNAGHISNIPSSLAEALGGEWKAKCHQVEHHHSHLASAFFVSPFDKAACLSLDGFGDFLSSMWASGKGKQLEELGQVTFPHSLGILYTAVTQYLGFPKYGDEYKVMGLASYGEPEYLDEFRKIIELKNGSFALNLKFFLHHSEGVDMTWAGGEPALGRVYSDEFVKKFGPARNYSDEIDPRHRNIACSLQAITEEIYLNLLCQIHALTAEKQVCVAGGVAFNSVANGKIRSHTPFEEVWIQPAAGDAGTALGAAFSVWNSVSNSDRAFVMEHAYWGPEFSTQQVQKTLEKHAEEIRALCGNIQCLQSETDLCRTVATTLADGQIVGWFQGRMEWGPRALGNRSILADPRRAETKDVLNIKIKKREPFRPFCPSILQEHVKEYFENAHPDPFMLSVYSIRPEKRAQVPAVTHVDGTGRLQSVSARCNPRFYRLLKEFGELTGVPILLNTSFNENEPIVCTPEEALQCFLRTQMDCLVLDSWIIRRGRASAPRV
ncbi:MAG: carbamoyltransferase [Acidobacteria bacterium]|nr:carbamoyltransferase [Acidobacteriota bacterium]